MSGLFDPSNRDVLFAFAYVISIAVLGLALIGFAVCGDLDDLEDEDEGQQ